MGTKLTKMLQPCWAIVTKFNLENVNFWNSLDEVLYCYRDLRTTRIGKGKSKGKINLKDYAFDEERPEKGQDARSTVSNQIMPPKK